MSKTYSYSVPDIQLFADAATGVSAADPGRQGSETADAPTSAPEAQPSPEQDGDRQKSYREFKLEHKREFDEEVQSIVRERLKKSASENSELKSRLDALAPLIQVLSDKLGVDASNPDALLARLDASGQRRERAGQTYLDWQRQAHATKQLYPSFELANQVGDPRFMRLLRAGVDVRTAYEVTHRDEVIGGAMRASAQRTAQRLAGSVLSGSLRPGENGLTAAAAVTHSPDVSKLTGEQLEQYKLRARQGEKIDFKTIY